MNASPGVSLYLGHNRSQGSRDFPDIEVDGMHDGFVLLIVMLVRLTEIRVSRKQVYYVHELKYA